MVAQTIPIPNIRKQFIPDRGYILCEPDLSQADARVVAWDAGAVKLKEIFRDPARKLHVENTQTLFGSKGFQESGKPDPHYYLLAKKGVHSVNYYITARSLARHLGIKLSDAESFIQNWFLAHPEIPAWHKRIALQLETTGIIYNPWGYRRVYFDRPGAILPEALGWLGQSTVAIAINKVMQLLVKNLQSHGFQLLSQTHDSLTYQVPISKFIPHLPIVQHCFNSVQIPYPDPLVIPCEMKASSISWGHVKEIPWDLNTVRGV